MRKWSIADPGYKTACCGSAGDIGAWSLELKFACDLGWRREFSLGLGEWVENKSNRLKHFPFFHHDVRPRDTQWL